MMISLQGGFVRLISDVSVVVMFLLLCFFLVYVWFCWVVPAICPLLISYHVSDTKIVVKLFHLIPCQWIDISDISEIQVVKWSARFFFVWHAINRPTRSYVLIRTKNRWLFTEFLITPKDPVAFVTGVKGLMEKNKFKNGHTNKFQTLV